MCWHPRAPRSPSTWSALRVDSAASAPSASGTSTISLEEGTYVYFCTFGDPPHYQNGMLGEFTVKDVASTAPLPDNAAEVDASEYKFDVNGLKAGENTFTFANKGQQFHHLIAVPMTEGATLDDVNTFLSSRTIGSGRSRPSTSRRSRTSR